MPDNFAAIVLKLAKDVIEIKKTFLLGRRGGGRRGGDGWRGRGWWGSTGLAWGALTSNVLEKGLLIPVITEVK